MKNFFSIFILVLILISCNKNQKNDKDIVLLASENSASIDTTDIVFKIFSDSSYAFNVKEKGNNYNKTENYYGKVQIKNDSLIFFPFRFEYLRAEKAVLKNNFIEFLDSDEDFRMKITKTSLNVKNLIDFANFKDYAVFTYYPIQQNKYEIEKFENYDLTTLQLKNIDKILTAEFNKRHELYKYSEYLKQIQAVKNKKGEKLVRVLCRCKSKNNISNFEKYMIRMSDGGKCNIYIVLNLTTNKIEIFSVAGMA